MRKINRGRARFSRPAPLTYFMPTAESLEFLEKCKEMDFTRFVAYWMKVKSRMPVEKAFKVWWAFMGPTGFYKTEDTGRYRKELYAYIITKISLATDEAPNGESNTSKSGV